jgi:serine/threonine protein kinase
MLIYNNKRTASICSRKSSRVVFGVLIPQDTSFEQAKHSKDTRLVIVKVCSQYDVVIEPAILREVSYHSYLSKHVFNPLTLRNEPSEYFTGIPALHHVVVDHRRDVVCMAIERLSKFGLDILLDNTQTSECFLGLESWFMQGLFMLAAMEQEGIMHRDIKCEHLLLNERGELALIDWGLATKLADNSYLSEYVITYPFRPLEIFYY